MGTQFERVSARTELYLDYYKELCGKEKGSYYAYVVPAFKRWLKPTSQHHRNPKYKPRQFSNVARVV